MYYYVLSIIIRTECGMLYGLMAMRLSESSYSYDRIIPANLLIRIVFSTFLLLKSFVMTSQFYIDRIKVN